MKQIVTGFFTLLAAGAVAQKQVPGPVVKILKNYNDTLSYAVGMNVADGLKQQKIPAPNASLMQKGMEAVLMNKTALLTPQQCSGAIQRSLNIVKTKAPAPKPVPGARGLLKTLADSASYAIGYNVGMNIRQQQLGDVSPALLCRALDAVNKKKPTLLTTEFSNQTVQKHMQSLYERLQSAANEKVNAEKAKGAAFLEANGKRPGVITTASGLQYEILKRGDTSSARPVLSDRFVANYAGTLIDGTEFDNSYKRGQPLELGVSQVIAGWTEALQLMHIGDKFKIYLPSSIGYGDRGAGAGIPGGATLIFEMELLGIKK